MYFSIKQINVEVNIAKLRQEKNRIQAVELGCLRASLDLITNRCIRKEQKIQKLDNKNT
jgi:hypothetical protein